MTVCPNRWPLPRIAAWAVTAVVIVGVVGPIYLRVFLPPERAYTDFIQEWLSVRNFFAGQPIYREVSSSLEDHITSPQSGEQAETSDGTKRRKMIAFTDTESGAIIEANDPNWDRLTAQARMARENPAIWLEMSDIYGDLAKAPAFIEAFTKCLNFLWKNGTTASLEAYLANRL